MSMLNEELIEEGVIVRLSKSARNPMFAGCHMLVTEVRSWGAIGYVQALGENGQPGGEAYYRAEWSEMDPVVWRPLENV